MPHLAVLGHPVSHSRSPAMHTAALVELGLSPEWTYEAVDVQPNVFAALVAGLPDRGFVGVNVTVPHKEAALELADEASDEASAIGAANTLTFADGRILAANTDATGLIGALPEPPKGSALVLGAGGAARAAIWALVRAGVDVQIWNRTHERAVSVAEELGGEAVEAPEPEEFDLILNSTSAGLGGGDQFASLPVQPQHLHDTQTVVDLVYGRSQTPLLRAAEEAGCATVDGLEILVCQGAASLLIWTGCAAPLDVMRAAARA